MARILIVEDDKPINTLIRKNLELVGHDCVSVFNGESVFDVLEKQAFDLVLLDMMLPKSDGYRQGCCGTPPNTLNPLAIVRRLALNPRIALRIGSV